MSINTKWISMGARKLYLSFYDNLGYLTGGNLSLTKGVISPDIRWTSAQTLSTTIPALATVSIPGDDSIQGFFVADRTDIPSMAIQVTTRDPAIENKLQGLPTYSRDQYDVLPIDPKIEGARQAVSMILMSESKSNIYGGVEQTGWEISQIFKGTISAGVPVGLENQTGHAVDFVMTFDRQYTYPEGVALSLLNEGTREMSGCVNGSLYEFRRAALLGDDILASVDFPEEVAADDTDTDINAIEIVEITDAGVVSILTPTTDFTTVINTGAGTTTITPSVGYGGVFIDDYRYIIGARY